MDPEVHEGKIGQEGNEDGLGSDCGREIGQCSGQSGCFHRDQDQVVPACEACRGHQRRFDDVVLSQSGNAQTSPTQGFGASFTDQKGHVAAALDQACSEVSAGGAGADNKDSLDILLAGHCSPSMGCLCRLGPEHDGGEVSFRLTLLTHYSGVLSVNLPSHQPGAGAELQAEIERK